MIISLFFLLLSINVQAQEGVKQRFFTSQDGLQISWVNSITISQNNTVTIVHSPTFDIARYDGYNFNYTINPSVNLGKTYEDFSGNLWSIDEGNMNNANFYSNDKWQNLQFDAGIPFMPTPGMGNKLLFIRDGDLKEFDKVKKQTRIIKRAEESQIGQFIDMTTFQDGSVWITGEDGVAKYLGQCDTCNSHEQWIDFQIPKSHELHHFNKPFEGVNGELILMSNSSKSKHNILAGFDGKTWQKLYTSQTDEIHYGWRGHDNSLWIIKGIQPPPPLSSKLKDWNLFHIQQGKETRIIKNRTLNRTLNDVVVEPNGAFWLATGSGLTHFTPTLWQKIGAGTDFNQHLQKIHEDLTGRLWFATGDSFFLWSNDKWESHQFNPVVFTGDICSLKNGLLIVGISETGGLALFNPVDKSSTVTFPFGNEKIRYYDQDKNGNCLIILQDLNGTSKLIRYDGEHIETLAVDLKIDGLTPGACEVTDIIQALNEDVWIVTFTEVIVFKKGVKKSFDLKKEFEWSFSTSILELANGNIWISGSKGIIQYDGENWSLVQSPEFETARMMTISRDSSIWVASGTGIHRWINGTWVSNSNEEGLPNTTIFDVFEDKQGTIWAATLNGAYCYYPVTDSDAPETVIPSDMNSHEAIPSGELQFVFEGHDKWDNTLDDQLQYSYRFDENSWTPFENITTARGVGLSTGPHVFEVRAMDRNGNIDQSPSGWAFTVLLPWYFETYFIILMVIAVSIMILSIRFAITRHRQVEKLVIIRTAELNKAKEKVEKSELELQSKNEEYEVINEELNQTNENLIKAKEKAEESDRLKSAFLANMSHEIRTPMNGILGFAELLQGADISVENQHGYIEIIKKSSDRLLNTVNDIIEISRIESGEVKQSVDEVKILNYLENLVAFFTPEIEKKGLEISIDNEISGLEKVIQTDKNKLNSISSNLIKNAIKYTNEGFIKVGFKLNEGQLIFYCKDSGIGIPKNRQKAIFNRFEQADIEDKQAHQGSGLGLAIVKSYLEILNGKIWVESEEGKGSIFYVALPYNPVKSKQNDLSLKEKSYDIKKKNINVLIVEDEEISSLHLSVLLNGFVQKVRSVQNGIEAVDACKNDSSIDLILMDIKMPKMGGFETTRKIREFNKKVIIIAQTAFAFEEDKQKALASGCNDFISKPIKKDKLIGLVNKYF